MKWNINIWILNNCFLVTGGSGFIGSNFIRNLLSKFDLDVVINLDNLSFNSLTNNLSDITSDKYIFYEGILMIEI